MKTAENSLRNDYQSLLLKTSLALLLPILIFAMIGCVPEEDLGKDYGPEVTATTVNTALDEAMGPLDIAEIRKDEYAERYQVAYVPGQSDIPQGANSLEVFDLQETESTLALTLIYTTLKYDESGSPGKPVSQELDFPLCKPGYCADSLATTSAAAQPLPLVPQFSKLWSMATSQSESEAPSTERVSFHNLKVTRYSAPPPESVRKSPDCRGLSPCELQITQVNYDVVFWLSDGTSEVVQAEYKTSPQLPFFSRYKLFVTKEGERVLSKSPLSFCQSYAIEATLVKTCENLMDFVPGVAAPETP